MWISLNTLKAELNPICYLLALLGAHHFLHVSRIRVNVLVRQIIGIVGSGIRIPFFFWTEYILDFHFFGCEWALWWSDL